MSDKPKSPGKKRTVKLGGTSQGSFAQMVGQQQQQQKPQEEKKPAEDKKDEK